MKKALIVINGFSKNRNLIEKAGRLQEALSERNIKSDIVLATKLLAMTNGIANNVTISEDYAFCLYLDKDSYLCHALSFLMPVYNSYESLVLSDDKMLTLQALQGQGIVAPLTISAPLCYVDNPEKEHIEEFLGGVEKRLSYPLVFKECHGSLGRQVRLIHDHEELVQCYMEHCQMPHLYEKYVPYHPGEDYRLIVIGDRVVASMLRKNEKDFRSNIALGGKGYDATASIPKSFKDVAVASAKALQLDYAGIDLAIGMDGEPVFLEANGNAFFSEIERVSHVDIASLLVEYILEKRRN